MKFCRKILYSIAFVVIFAFYYTTGFSQLIRPVSFSGQKDLFANIAKVEMKSVHISKSFINLNPQVKNPYSLRCYPNPLADQATIEFELFRQEIVSLKVYNILGKEVAVLYDGIAKIGKQRIFFDARDLSKGIYFIRLKTSETVESQKLIVNK